MAAAQRHAAWRIERAPFGGKVKETAKWQTVEGDATVVLPLIVGELFDRLRD